MNYVTEMKYNMILGKKMNKCLYYDPAIQICYTSSILKVHFLRRLLDDLSWMCFSSGEDILDVNPTFSYSKVDIILRPHRHPWDLIHTNLGCFHTNKDNHGFAILKEKSHENCLKFFLKFLT